MKRLPTRSAVYLVLATIGVLFVFYSMKIGNYIMVASSFLFMLVSIDNIFCGLAGKKNGNPA